MHIDGIGASELNSVSGVQKPVAPKTKAVKSSKPGDNINISKQSKFQHSLQDAISKVPDIREDRIAEITNKLENNTYNVSSRDIADKIMGDEQHNGLRLDLFG